MGILEGLIFALKNSLTRREIELYLCFLQSDQPQTINTLTQQMKMKPKTLHKILMNLRIKQLIIVGEKDSKGTNIYCLK